MQQLDNTVKIFLELLPKTSWNPHAYWVCGVSWANSVVKPIQIMNMKLFAKPLGALFLALVSQASLAQALESQAAAHWAMGAVYAEESVGQGLPVLALDRSDWPSYRSGESIDSNAWRSIRAELNATHSTGWRMAALVRTEAWIGANADGVTAAALEATRTDPEVARSYTPEIQALGWLGAGIMLGTPWLKVDQAGRWQWQVGGELLQLRQLRTAELSGTVSYQGGGAYEFDLRSQRANTKISGPYLAKSGASGVGATLSLALQGQPAPGWHVQLRADDLASRLYWADLATDTNALNSQVTSRTPDGYLEYGPLLKGKKELLQTTRQIGVNWQARLAWAAFESLGHQGAATLRASRKAGINQVWVGWDSGNAGGAKPQWRLEVAPLMSAAKAELFWGGWQMAVASDGKGLSTQYRQLSLGWQYDF